MRYGK